MKKNFYVFRKNIEKFLLIEHDLIILLKNMIITLLLIILLLMRIYIAIII